MTAADIPATAVAVLRERAEGRRGWQREMSADELRAVADLMEALRDQSPACVFQDGTDGFICLLCRHASENGEPSEHNAWCPLAALERLITEATR